MNWRFFAGEHFAAIQQKREAPISGRAEWQMIAELHNLGSVDDVKRRGYLMAAAPELYAALVELTQGNTNNWTQRIRTAREALAKARGES